MTSQFAIAAKGLYRAGAYSMTIGLVEHKRFQRVCNTNHCTDGSLFSAVSNNRDADVYDTMDEAEAMVAMYKAHYPQAQFKIVKA